MKRTILLPVIAVLAIGATASAQIPGFGGPGPGGRGGPAGYGLLDYDTNADGRLTRAEFDTALRNEFNQLDGNRDGSATPEEIRVGREAQGKARHEAALKTRFVELDANRNGQLTEAEFLAGMQAPNGGPMLRVRGDGPGPGFGQGRPGPDRDGRGRGGPRGPEGRQVAPGGPPVAGAPPPAAPAARPQRAGPQDADNSGTLTLAEFTTRPNEAFTRADTNKDGTVTLAELQARSGAR